MRHGDKINNLSRTHSHRISMLSNMACSLIEHKRIFTTLAKAKALRVYVEPLLTKSKSNTTHSRRTVFAKLKDKHIVAMLFKDVAEKIADRPGGYTRVIKTGTRKGDAAEMAMVELVDFNETYTSNKTAIGATTVKTKTTRRSRAKKPTTDATDATETKSEE